MLFNEKLQKNNRLETLRVVAYVGSCQNLTFRKMQLTKMSKQCHKTRLTYHSNVFLQQAIIKKKIIFEVEYEVITNRLLRKEGSSQNYIIKEYFARFF